MLSHFSRIQLFAIPWAIPCKAPLSMVSPGKNTGVDCHALLQVMAGVEPVCPMSPALEGRFCTTNATKMDL